MTVLFGKASESYVKSSELLAVGVFRLGIVVAEKEALLIGSGRVDVLAGFKCVLVATGGPLVVNVAHCVEVVAFGGKHPVLVGTLRSEGVYARRTYVKELHARKAVLGELCAIENLDCTEKVVFTDPHTYVVNVESVGEVEFAYSTLEAGS
ncbi:MAG: hypothetical protein ACP5KA_00155 [Desulfurococcaceae archaeon]